MKGYYVVWADKGGREGCVVLPTYWKLLLWFVRTARKCNDIKIWIG